jgi:hypothetical protein
MNESIKSKLVHKARKVQEKLRGVQEIHLDFPVFVTLYPPFVEYAYVSKYTDAQRLKVSIKNLKKYLSFPEYKGRYIRLSEILASEHPAAFQILQTQSEENVIDFNWVTKQNEYISQLSKRDILTACGYTYTGDVVLNSYLKGRFDILKYQKSLRDISAIQKASKGYRYRIWEQRIYPFFTQIVDIVYQDGFYGYNRYMECLEGMLTMPIETWHRVFELYKSDLQRIIYNAPTNTSSMIVWRGVQELRIHDFKKSNGIYHDVDQFSSTTLNVNMAQEFSGYHEDNYGVKCCLLQILLIPGSHSLLMIGLSYASHELEIVLNINTKYLLKENKVVNVSPDMSENYYRVTKAVTVK